jgi:hypothetical protein
VKRVAAILLLGVLLFNWGGYRLFTNYLENRADTRLEASLDQNDYDESELVSIKVATHLPYYASSPNYERVDGEITIKGVSYKYVKRRLYNDSLELLCIPNVEKTGLRNAKDNFYRMANDLANDNSSSKKSGGNHSHVTKFAVSDFTDEHGFVWQYNSIDERVSRSSQVFADIRSAFLDRLEKPPQA